MPTYVADPWSSDFSLAPGSASDLQSGTLEELTGGLWGYDGRQIYEVASPFNRFTIGQLSEVSVQIDPGKGLEITYEIPQSGLETVRAGDAQSVISGSVVLQTGAGPFLVDIAPGTFASAVGERVTIRPGADFESAYGSVPRDWTLAQARTLAGDPTLRFATASEITAHSIAGWLASKYGSLIGEIAAQGGLPGNPIAVGDSNAALQQLTGFVMQQQGLSYHVNRVISF